MQWLISQMWILLAVAGLLGLILGLALRGLMSGKKMRRASVERDIARTELGQARAEIDSLYASQRKMKESGVVSVDTTEVDNLHTQLAQRDQQISDLQMSLQSARDDAQAAQADKSNRLQTAGAAVAGAAAGALLGGGDDERVKELEERNSWLEERVAALESDLEATPETANQVDAAAAAQAGHVETPTGPSQAKLEWQNTYLRQRVEALEEQMHVAAPVTPDAAPANDEGVAAIIDTPEAEHAETDNTAPNEEELARLRWRNRYLEGRLAYYEEGSAAAEVSDAEAEDADEDEDKGGLIAAAVAGAGLVAATVMSDEEDNANEEEATDEVSPSSSEDLGTDDTDYEADEADEADEAFQDESEDLVETVFEDETTESIEDEHPSEAVLRAMDEAEADAEDDDEDQSIDILENETEIDGEDGPEQSAIIAETDGDAEPDEEQNNQDEPETEDGSEPVSAPVDLIQPAAINTPFAGGDDLTQIGGVGPRIAEVLNGLGIWTHQQIADWTPENAAWIEEHLSFKGRVTREQWVEQAKVLVTVSSDASD